MSLFLNPILLILLGALLYLVKIKLDLSGQITRIIGILIFFSFSVLSILLFVDFIVWPANLFDLTSPFFEFISGKEWMLHSDLTGISDINLVLFCFLILLYAFWLFLGYEIVRSIHRPDEIIIVSTKEFSTKDVNSRLRLKPFSDDPMVAVIRHENPRTALLNALNRIGGIKNYIKSKDLVVIKANICGGNPLIRGSYTSIDVVDELVKEIRRAGGNPVVVDSDMIWTDFKPVAEAQGWLEWGEKNDVPIVNLKKTGCVYFKFESFNILSKHRIAISKLLIDADVIISFPTMKTHLLTNVTLGMKNMYGTFPTGEKAKFHEFGIEKVIVGMISAFTPTLTIIDGSIGGESIGPLSCRPVNANLIIASNDVVAADAIASQIIGYDPQTDIEHIKQAIELKVGKTVNFSLSQIEGDSYEKDGQWVKPDPAVCESYNELLSAFLQFPGAKKFTNAAADFVLYDLASFPFVANITPVFLGVFSDALGGVLRIFNGKPRGGRKRKRLSEKFRERATNNEDLFTEELDNVINEIKIIDKKNSFLLSILFISLTLFGFVIGGFWNKTLSNFNAGEGVLYILIFILGLILCFIIFLLYGMNLDQKALLVILIFSSTFALVQEFLLSSATYIIYLDDQLISLLFSVLGYPLFIGIIIGISNYILKYIYIPDVKSTWINISPVLVLIAIIPIALYFDESITLFSNSNLLVVLGIILTLVILPSFSIFYAINHSFRQNLVLIIISLIMGTIMEMLGFLVGYWSYDAINVPMSIIILWGVRTLAVMGLLSAFHIEILSYGKLKRLKDLF
ncbi:MAG: hypothetical protein HeimC3_32330 [Candidatus Heimdallarchaeota archaeon LC_3]|nr:MAG: hypothetical protein HeimC3_32330 [Candidatus Heimdallarchaeota archaeon LC_3]